MTTVSVADAPLTKKQIETAATRPPMMPVNYPAVPPSLQAHAGWVAWHWWYNAEDERWTKVPLKWSIKRRSDCIAMRASKLRVEWYLSNAKSNNPGTWSAFDNVTVRLIVREELYAPDDLRLGLGFMLDRSFGVTVIDLDDCRDRTTGVITPEARAIVDRLNSYTEVSPSGTGLKIYVLAAKPGPRCKNIARGIEVYDHRRFVAVTGNRLEGTPEDLQPRQAELAGLYAELFPDDEHERGHERAATETDRLDVPTAGDYAPRSTLTLDAELIDKAFNAANGSKFAALWRGDTSTHGDDASAADFALAGHLAFWCGPDPDRIESLMWQSGLRRPKWRKHRTYLRMTINRAIARCHTFYGDDRHQGDESWDGTLVPPCRRRQGHSGCTCPRCGPAADAIGSDGATVPGGGADDIDKIFGDVDPAEAARRRAEFDRQRKTEHEVSRAAAEKEWTFRGRFPCPDRNVMLFENQHNEGRTRLTVRCNRWTCPGCSRLFKHCWAENIRLRFTDDTLDRLRRQRSERLEAAGLEDKYSPDGFVYVATVPRGVWRSRLQRRCARQFINAFMFSDRPKSPDLTIYATADIFDGGCERLTPADAAARLIGELDRYTVSAEFDQSAEDDQPGRRGRKRRGLKRPINATRAWRLPKREKSAMHLGPLIGRATPEAVDQDVRALAKLRGFSVNDERFYSGGYEDPRLSRLDITFPSGWSIRQRKWVEFELLHGRTPLGPESSEWEGPPPEYWVEAEYTPTRRTRGSGSRDRPGGYSQAWRRLSAPPPKDKSAGGGADASPPTIAV